MSLYRLMLFYTIYSVTEDALLNEVHRAAARHKQAYC